MHKISIVIPCYEMYGLGTRFLERNLDAIERQSFKDFEVVVSDNSENDDIRSLCEAYSFDLVYVKNPVKGIAANTNSAIAHATSELIKILYEDDYFATDDSLKRIVEAFGKKDMWLATGCLHLSDGALVNPHYPSYNKDIYHGYNTIGSPSVVTIRRGEAVRFDEKLTWLLDCDYYAHLYKEHGEPKMLYDLNVVIGLGSHQVTNALSEAVKQKETDYMMKKII